MRKWYVKNREYSLRRRVLRCYRCYAVGNVWTAKSSSIRFDIYLSIVKQELGNIKTKQRKKSVKHLK